jgi:ATP-binding cassette subfamily C (CFTR/MRP) protein 4
MLATKISLSISLLTVTWYLLIVISIYLGDHIKPEILFLIMDSLNNLMLTLNVQFPKGIHEFVKLKAVFRRISKFLQTKEKVVCKNQGEDCNEAILSNLTVYVNDHKIFNNINFKLQKGLTILTGPMGSGKTLLLKVLMREYQFIEGDLKLAGEISYASQESWLFPSTMKQNILFGSSYDKERYNEVLELCELRKDLEAFDEGDDTIVADRGTNLSGGQQKRINLARAIYRKSDTYLLDDCLTNLDVVVANSIFEKCIKGFLKNKTVIMISQNEKYVNRADNILTINEGLVNLLQNVSAQKAFSYKSATTQENHLLVPPTQEHQEGDLYSNENATLIEPKVSEKNIYEESKELAQVKMETYRTYFRQGGGIKILLLICVVFCATQFSKSSIRKLEANWLVMLQSLEKIILLCYFVGLISSKIFSITQIITVQ